MMFLSLDQVEPTTRAARPLEERFWNMVSKGAPNECWEWKGAIYTNGYASFSLKRNGRWRPTKASRVCYAITKGPMPAHLEVMHSCDNRICVNPAHLSLGTKSDNMQDAIRKGRKPTPVGKRNRTTCKLGHPFDAANTRYTPQGHRRCRICVRAALKRQRLIAAAIRARIAR